MSHFKYAFVKPLFMNLVKELRYYLEILSITNMCVIFIIFQQGFKNINLK
jgi:hypothetical protein